MDQQPITITKYLHRELQFQLREYTALPDKDKDDLRRWARKEMEIFGIPVKEG